MMYDNMHKPKEIVIEYLKDKLLSFQSLKNYDVFLIDLDDVELAFDIPEAHRNLSNFIETNFPMTVVPEPKVVRNHHIDTDLNFIEFSEDVFSLVFKRHEIDLINQFIDLLDNNFTEIQNIIVSLVNTETDKKLS